MTGFTGIFDLLLVCPNNSDSYKSIDSHNVDKTKAVTILLKRSHIMTRHSDSRDPKTSKSTGTTNFVTKY